MYTHIEGDSSFNEILQMMKHFKIDTRSKDNSTIDFSEKQSSYSSRNTEQQHQLSIPNNFPQVNPSLNRNRQPLANLSPRNYQKNYQTTNSHNTTIPSHHQDQSTFSHYHCSTHHHQQQNVFTKLYEERKEIARRKTLLEYESKRSKQKLQDSICTFSPNIHQKHYQSRSPAKTNTARVRYDSLEENQSFYRKNVQWQQRREKSIKMMQCEKNQQNLKNGVCTFTPKINKFDKKKIIGNGIQNKQNQNTYETAHSQTQKPLNTCQQIKGVNGYLNRQNKGKKKQQHVENRKQNPYSHVWNIKKQQGHFSYV